MRICYLANADSYHTRKWCDYFSKNGHDISVISLVPGEIEGVTVYHFNEKDIINRTYLSKLSYVFHIFKIRKLLKLIKPDYLHSHYVSSYGLLGVLSGFHPHISSAWGSDVLIFPQNSFVNKCMVKYVLKYSDYLMSTSVYMAEKMKQIYSNREIHITPFGVNTSFFKSTLKPTTVKKEFTIGIVKPLKYVYGHDILIKSVAELVRLYDDIKVRVVIIGDGPEKNNLINLTNLLNLKDKITFKGYLPHDNLLIEMEDFDLAIYPSRSESFGVSVLEAQSFGIPVIVSDIQGLKEVIVENVTGLTFKSEDYQNLAATIKWLIDNQEIANNMGRSGRVNCQKKFELKDNFDYILSLYKKWGGEL